MKTGAMTARPFPRLLVWAAFLCAALPWPAAAELKIDVTRGVVEPMPIAIPVFDGQTDKDKQLGQDISEVISADLQHSGLFKPIDPAAFIQTGASLQVQPRFSDWRLVNAQALLTGTAGLQEDGRIKVEFRLWDVFAEQQMIGFAYSTVPQSWRRLAHKISDAVYKRITGEDGYFDTRIVYISETGPQRKRIKRLAIMDQDGAEHSFLTDGRELVLTPRFSPTAQEITYLSYVNNKPRVYIFNIDTGQQEVLGDFPGMTFAPRFSPDGNKVIMSLAADGNSDIYVMDLRTRAVQRVTNHPAIDTSPSYSPDGTQIVFNSDRGGSPQLYTASASGENVTRISFGQGRYSTPVWSPRGDLIAFTKQSGGEFFIGVMRPDGSGDRSLAKGFLVEGPTWAPNGRLLAYFRQDPTDASGGGGTTRLYSIDITGYNEREIITPLDASDPAWSPLLP
ncbi:MAG: Tol-Pal system beta propeller repeat protein TolB [Alphaproteobacteria bacterium]